MSEKMTGKQMQALFSIFLANFDPEGITRSVVQDFIERPIESGRQFNEFVRNGPRLPLAERNFQLWRKLLLRGIGNIPDFIKELEAAGMQVWYRSLDLFKAYRFTSCAKTGDAELALVMPRHLGFMSVTRFEDICRRAHKMGLNLCPSNLALELLLDFKGQKKGDNNIFVAMESLWSDEHNRNQIFEIEFATSQPRLSSVVAEPDSIFGPDCQFVFLRNEMR